MTKDEKNKIGGGKRTDEEISRKILKQKQYQAKTERTKTAICKNEKI